MKRDLRGRCAVVTGASAGIGREIALELARRQVKLLLLARNAERLQDVVRVVNAAGSDAEAVVGDITNPQVRQELVQRSMDRMGGLDLLVNNAGVGRIGIADFDVVDYSNLQRQIIHGTPDVGRSKLESAKSRLNALNPEVEVVMHEMALSSENALQLFADYDMVIDGTDNFPTRYLVNDACVMSGKPNVYGSIFRFEGQASVFATRGGPCYRCMFPEPPPPGLVPSCAEGGVLGVLPGIVGTIQATEAIKLILGEGEPLIGRVLLVDALKMRFRELKVRQDPDWTRSEHPECRPDPPPS